MELVQVMLEIKKKSTRNVNEKVSEKCLTGMQPALEGEAAFLDIKWEVVDVEGAGCDHLDGLVVAHQSVMCHIDVRYVWRLPHIYTAGQRQKWQQWFPHQS